MDDPLFAGLEFVELNHIPVGPRSRVRDPRNRSAAAYSGLDLSPLQYARPVRRMTFAREFRTPQNNESRALTTDQLQRVTYTGGLKRDAGMRPSSRNIACIASGNDAKRRSWEASSLRRSAAVISQRERTLDCTVVRNNCAQPCNRTNDVRGDVAKTMWLVEDDKCLVVLCR